MLKLHVYILICIECVNVYRVVITIPWVSEIINIITIYTL